ncbi:MAG: TylF/MycF/NovP-related O-methyltransferase [Bryobacteraceae bacterium]
MFHTRTREHYSRDGLFTVHNQSFRRDPGFLSAYSRGVQASDGVDPEMEWRVHVALWVARNAARVPGDFVECGVNAGFVSSAIMQRLDWAAVGKQFYLIDTFNGPVVSQFTHEEVKLGRRRLAESAIECGAYVTDLDRVRANYAEWPNVNIIQGMVPDVLNGLAIGKIAFLHLDMNCAYPERAALEHFWERLSPGAMVLLDDYAYVGNDGLAQAIAEAAQSFGADVLSLPTGQGLIMK